MFSILQSTLYQLAAILGFFFVIGFVLSQLQSFTQRMYHRSVGWRGILWTAVIGTPVHELGHYFFCKIFRHRVQAVSLYKPNQRTGNLGSVNHSYNPRSIYQKIGNFFIGAAPLIWGSLALVLLIKFLLPNGQPVVSEIHNLSITNPAAFLGELKNIITLIFSPANLHSVQFWIWLYVSFAIAAHLAPSWEDQKTMWRGLLWILLILIMVNSLAFAVNYNVTPIFLKIKAYQGLFIFAFWYALAVSLAHAVAAYVILWPIRLMRNR